MSNNPPASGSEERGAGLRSRPDHATEADLEIAALAPGATEEPPEIIPRKGPLRAPLHWLGVGEKVVGASLVALIMILVLVQVAQRYLPVGGWVWTGEVARFGLVWCTLSLSGYLMSQDRHIAMHVIDYVTPARALSWIKLVAHGVVAVTCVAMSYEAYHLIVDRSGQVSPAARIPLTWIYVIPFLGFVMTALRATLAVFMKDLRATDPIEEEQAA